MVPITCNAAGDILALAALIIDIAHALNESRGSASEYRAFIAELNSLHIVLASISRVAEVTTDVKLRGEIVGEVDRCGQDVQQALQCVVKFSALGHDEGTRGAQRVKLKRQWYKLEWRFGQRGHVQDIRAKLAATTQRLSAYLVTSNANSINELRTSLTAQFNTLTARLCTSLLEHFAGMAAISRAVEANTATLHALQLSRQKNSVKTHEAPPGGVDSSKAAAVALLCVAICTAHETPRAVHTALLLAAVCILMGGMTRHESGTKPIIQYSQSNSITLNDALGRSIVLPLELCATYDVFHATLVNLFSHTNGHWFIEAHRYVISRAHDDYCISEAEWDEFIHRGMELDMDIVVLSTMSKDVYVCPVCLAIKRYSSLNVGPCLNCGRAPEEWVVDLTHFEPRVAAGPQAGLRETATLVPEPDAGSDLGMFPRLRRVAEAKTHSTVPMQAYDAGFAPELDWKAQTQDFKHIQIHTPKLSVDLSGAFSAPDEGHHDLRTAAENGHRALVAALLDGGVDVNASFGLGYTALHLASFYGHVDIASYLLDCGATIDADAEGHVTPLACALIYKRDAVTKLLLARGAIADAPKPTQAVAFYAAVQAGNVDVVRMLLRLGLDANAQRHGETALYAAVQNDYHDIAELLSQNAADIHARSSTGDTPLLLAAVFGKVEIFTNLLTAPGASALPPASEQKHLHDLLHDAIWGGSPIIVALVLQHTGADPNARFQDGPTLLSFASSQEHEEIVELLLEQGADPNSGERGSWKALHAASYNGHVKIVKTLLRYDADVDARTDQGDTPLSLALTEKVYHLMKQWNASHFDEVFEVLLSSGAIIDERSSLLMQELASRSDLSNSKSGPHVPGAWCEEP